MARLGQPDGISPSRMADRGGKFEAPRAGRDCGRLTPFVGREHELALAEAKLDGRAVGNTGVAVGSMEADISRIKQSVTQT
jgi:hypothetical protein